MKTLIVLGRQPKLGLAELESLYGSELVQPIGSSYAILGISPDKINFNRLGGAVKICRILNTGQVDPSSLEQFIRSTVIDELLNLHFSKVNFGLSGVSGRSSDLGKLKALALSIKSELKTKHEQSSRVITANDNQLNAAQVTHNGLTGKKGYEFIVIKEGEIVTLAATCGVQDIDSYSERDYGRPKRDPRVGMLPPKLAQIIINFAVGSVAKDNLTVLDPFCGTGVVLQEALLMGYQIYGSDIDNTMLGYTSDNIGWLTEKFQLPVFKLRLERGDATNYRWQPLFDTIASEAYLGRAYSNYPSPDNLNQNISDTNTIIEKFLINLSAQIPTGFRFCLAIPVWIGKADKLHRLPLLDHLNKLGYNRLSFEHVRDADLIYYRPTQFVGRELLIIVKGS